MPFTSVPAKINLKIISYLDYESLISFARTSRYFKNVTPRYAVFSALLDLEYLEFHKQR
jgi:hypothetical protein